MYKIFSIVDIRSKCLVWLLSVISMVYWVFPSCFILPQWVEEVGVCLKPLIRKHVIEITSGGSNAWAKEQSKTYVVLSMEIPPTEEYKVSLSEPAAFSVRQRQKQLTAGKSLWNYNSGLHPQCSCFVILYDYWVAAQVRDLKWSTQNRWQTSPFIAAYHGKLL